MPEDTRTPYERALCDKFARIFHDRRHTEVTDLVLAFPDDCKKDLESRLMGYRLEVYLNIRDILGASHEDACTVVLGKVVKPPIEALAVAHGVMTGIFWWASLYEGPGWIEAGGDLVCDNWTGNYRPCACSSDGTCQCLRSDTEYHPNGSFLCVFCKATMWHRPCAACRNADRGPFCAHRFHNVQ